MQVHGYVVSNTGAPQGTVLSPFLFTLYTTDFRVLSPAEVVKRISLSWLHQQRAESEDRSVGGDFVSWCNQSHLHLNITKTKELVVDLRKTKTLVTLVSIQEVEGLQVPGSQQ